MKPLDARGFQELHEAWMRYLVLFFRDQVDYFPETRSGFRVTVKGERPYFEP